MSIYINNNWEAYDNVLCIKWVTWRLSFIKISCVLMNIMKNILFRGVPYSSHLRTDVTLFHVYPGDMALVNSSKDPVLVGVLKSIFILSNLLWELFLYCIIFPRS